MRGEFLQLKEKVITSEITRVAREVGTKMAWGSQAIAPGAAGTWKDLTENVNFMSSNLTSQMRNIAVVGFRRGRTATFSKKITADVRGEFLQLKEKVNMMVDQLSLFTSEVTRVAREVGTEGKLGSQAIAPGAAAGKVEDLTENVNIMSLKLTSQMRNIADITTAVANGDFSEKIAQADVRGEFLQLKEKVNTMVDQLSLFTSEVTRVAEKSEGKLSGQAIAPGAANGTWKLTDNVNFMSSNLTKPSAQYRRYHHRRGKW